MNIKKKKITFLFLLTHFISNSQNTAAQLRAQLSYSISEFKVSTRQTDDFRYIDFFFFEKLISQIDPKVIPAFSKLDSTDYFNIRLCISAIDTSIVFYYRNSVGLNYESYYNQCDPYKKHHYKYEPNTITSFCGQIEELISVRTIQNVVITEPAKRKYHISTRYRKAEALKEFKQKLFGQYQLEINISKNHRETGFFSLLHPALLVYLDLKFTILLCFKYVFLRFCND